MQVVKFYVGQRVITNKSVGDFPEGSWGTVTEIDMQHSFPYAVRLDTASVALMYEGDELQPLDDPTAEPGTTISVTPDEVTTLRAILHKIEQAHQN